MYPPKNKQTKNPIFSQLPYPHKHPKVPQLQDGLYKKHKGNFTIF